VSDDLQKLLDFDPLDVAEQLTGTLSADKDSPAMALGLALMRRHSAMKEGALASHDDTMLDNRLDRYQRIVTDLGFEQVMADSFVGHGNETYFIYAHRDGILLTFDTFTGNKVNGGKFLYNWAPSLSWKELRGLHLTSSGHMNGDIWIGDHDCREAIRHKIGQLRKHGSFISPWKERPWLWLLHYADSKVDGYDHDAITQARVARLPDWVREFIGP
jgi:hypothetical protein